MNRIVKTAYSWLDVKFKHQGRTKEGCDCLGFILNLNVICKNGMNLKAYDQTNYARRVESNILQKQLDEHLLVTDELEPGNIVLFNISKHAQHLAVISEITPYINIIHSNAQVRKVIKQMLPSGWKISRVYRSLV